MKLQLLTILFLLSSTALACITQNEFTYCEGDSVINKSGLRGRIDIFINEEYADIHYPQYGEMYVTEKISSLAALKGSSGSYKMFDKVFTTYGIKGRITGIFQDGKVAVSKGSALENEVYFTSSLAKAEGCTATNFCVGDIVTNKYGKKAEVVGVFPKNDKVFIYYESQDRFFKWSTDNLVK